MPSEIAYVGNVLRLVVNGEDAAHPALAVGTALDELVAFAIREGASETDLRERLDASFDYAEEVVR